MSNWHTNSVKSLEFEFGYQESFDFTVGNESSHFNIPQLESLFPASYWPSAELSEVLCDQYETGLQLLLPLLAEQSAQNRWITMIAPPANMDQKLFAHFGIDMSHVLLIHPKNDVDDQVTMNKALKNGKSHIVILWTKNLSKRFLAQWRKSVKQGNCTGILIHENTQSCCSSSIALTVEAKSVGEAISLSCSKMFGTRKKKTKNVILPKVALEQSGVQPSNHVLPFQLLN